jgi:hypothetical protein
MDEGIWIRIKSLRIARIVIDLLKEYSIGAHAAARRARGPGRARELREEADEADAQAEDIREQLKGGK